MQTHEHSGWHWTALAIASLIALIWIVFGQTGHFEFVNYDDQNYVYQNSQITKGLSIHGLLWAFTHVHSQNWHPLTTISHMLDCQFYGLDAGKHHLNNVLLHTAAAILLFLILRRITKAFGRSAFVAAVFAVHPLRVESVAWISERKDVLSGLFFMLTIACYASYSRKPSLSRYLMTAIAFALGLLAKPMLVSLPLILLLLDYWPLNRFPGARRSQEGPGPWKYSNTKSGLFLEKLPLLLLSAASCFATLKAQGEFISSADVLPLTFRLENACISYLNYIAQTVWPFWLSPFYPHPAGTLPTWQVMGSALILAMVTIAIVIGRRKRPYLFSGWLWYLIMLLPVIGIVQVGWQGQADRYTYLPSIGLLIAITWSLGEIARAPGWSRILPLFAGAVVIVLAFFAWKQTSYWRNSEALWTHALAVTSKNDVAENNLGIVLLSRGKVAEAMAHYETAIALRPTNTEARANLANALLFQGRPDEAIDQLRQILEVQPDNLEARNTFGAVLAGRGETRAAVAQWEQVLTAHPENGNAQADLAWVLATSPDATLRDGARALDLAQRALQLSGGSNAMLYRTLAAAYAENGRFADACELAEQGSQIARAQGNSALVRDLEMNIASYRAGIPLRESSRSTAAGNANGT